MPPRDFFRCKPNPIDNPDCKCADEFWVSVRKTYGGSRKPDVAEDDRDSEHEKSKENSDKTHAFQYFKVRQPFVDHPQPRRFDLMVQHEIEKAINGRNGNCRISQQGTRNMDSQKVTAQHFRYFDDILHEQR